MGLTEVLWYSLLPTVRDPGDDSRTLSYHPSLGQLGRCGKAFARLGPSHGIQGLGCHLQASQDGILQALLENQSHERNRPTNNVQAY